MSKVMFRSGRSVYLRPHESTDIPHMLRGMNDPEVTKYLMRVFPVSEKEEEEWLDSMRKNPSAHVLAIVLHEEDRPIGTIDLHGISWQNRTATTGTVLWNEEDWGKGYGTEAKMLLLDFAFNALDLFAIQSRVLDFNGRSLRYADKCGYKEVGRIPRWIRGKDGKRHDEVILVVTQKRWREIWIQQQEEKAKEPQKT